MNCITGYVHSRLSLTFNIDVASQDDYETYDLITSILKLGITKFVCLQQEVILFVSYFKVLCIVYFKVLCIVYKLNILIFLKSPSYLMCTCV